MKTNNHYENLRYSTQKTIETPRRQSKRIAQSTKECIWINQRGNGRHISKLLGNWKNLGYYESEREAAEAYNRAAIDHFREYTCINEFSEYFHNVLDHIMKPILKRSGKIRICKKKQQAIINDREKTIATNYRGKEEIKPASKTYLDTKAIDPRITLDWARDWRDDKKRVEVTKVWRIRRLVPHNQTIDDASRHKSDG